jgi:hypothetical protein
MKSYKQFIAESKMTNDEAMKILGLSGSYTPEDVKKAYKVASSKNHPDKGGDTETMKSINVAYEKLKDSTGKAGLSKQSYEERSAWWRDIAKTVQLEIKSKYKPEEFVKYFNSAFKQDFKETTVWGEISETSSPSYVNVKTEFANADKTIAFDFFISVYLANVVNSKNSMSLSSNENISYPISITAYGYANKKKQKMAQNDYSSTIDHSVVFDPKMSFPLAKLKKMSATPTKPAKMTKASFALAIQKELGGLRWNDDSYKIDLSDGMLLFYRTTMLGKGFWTAQVGVQNGKYRFTGQSKMHSFDESAATIDELLKLKSMNLHDATNHLNALSY